MIHPCVSSVSSVSRVSSIKKDIKLFLKNILMETVRDF
jgi:hypothetical protein